jgi:hypothetical protein
VHRDPSKKEIERLFVDAIDEELACEDERPISKSLTERPELQAQFSRYRDVVKLLREAPRTPAPPALAATILRRARRRRFHTRTAELVEQYRVPAEVILPLLLAAIVALAMFLGAH